MMAKKCFYCDIQQENDDKQKIFENEHFFSRFDDFPVSPGHCEIIIKGHISSFFDLSEAQLLAFHDLLKKTKNMIQQQFKTQDFNLGINEGKLAGRTQDHFHLHLIPRYVDDVEKPLGGIRNIFPEKGDYSKEVEEKFPKRKIYLEK